MNILGGSTMVIKILGGGCANCKVLYNNAASALKELEMEAQIVKVEDFSEITKYDVMSTPALVIDEKVVGLGKMKYKKVLELIKNA
jgi:small redox-active disulfide protein 2